MMTPLSPPRQPARPVTALLSQAAHPTKQSSTHPITTMSKWAWRVPTTWAAERDRRVTANPHNPTAQAQSAASTRRATPDRRTATPPSTTITKQVLAGRFFWQPSRRISLFFQIPLKYRAIGGPDQQICSGGTGFWRILSSIIWPLSGFLGPDLLAVAMAAGAAGMLLIQFRAQGKEKTPCSTP
jgi:hypothetical protein